MVTLQQQAENILNFFHYFPIMTPEGKKFMKQRTDLYKKWIDDLKKAMDEGYSKVEAFYDDEQMASLRNQTKEMFDSYMDKANWMPQDVKKLMDELDAIYKNGCDEFKKYVEENRRQVENYYNNLYKSQKKDKK